MTSSYNSITGTDSANTLIGNTGSDSFSALAGDDTVLGAQGNDIIDLGAGNDSVVLAAVLETTILGGSGDDTFGFSSVESGEIDAGSGADSLYFDGDVSGTTTVLGGEGDDTFGFAGSVTGVIAGGLGSDSLVFEQAQTAGSLTYVFGSDGDDGDSDFGAADTLYFGPAATGSPTDPQITVAIGSGMTASDITFDLRYETDRSGTFVDMNAGTINTIGFVANLTESQITLVDDGTISVPSEFTI